MSIEEKFYEMAENGRLNQSPVFVVPSIQKRLDSDHSRILHNFGRWSMVDGRWSMVDALWLMVDDLWSMACGLWSMVDVNWLTHGVTSSPVCLHRESNQVVQAVDRQFGVTAVLSGWENVVASQQDAFSWRALAQHLSVLSTRTLMRRALEVIFIFVFISSSLIFLKLF